LDQWILFWSNSSDMFRRHDQSRDGKLDPNEFGQVCQELRFPGSRMFRSC
jgi:hypothetical protein